MAEPEPTGAWWPPIEAEVTTYDSGYTTIRSANYPNCVFTCNGPFADVNAAISDFEVMCREFYSNPPPHPASLDDVVRELKEIRRSLQKDAAHDW